MVPNQESEKDDDGSRDDEDEDEKLNKQQKDMDKPKIIEDRKTPQKGM